MMNSPLVHVKVPEGCLARAREQEILRDILFYYQLKTLNIQGHFWSSEIKTFARRFNLGRSTVWLKIKRLRELGLLNKDRDSYTLVKYDVLYRKLGYNVQRNFKQGKLRKGSFKLFLIASECVNKLLLYVAREELRLNKQRQLYKAFRNCKGDRKCDTDNLTAKKVYLERKFEDNITQSIDLSLQGQYTSAYENAKNGDPGSGSFNPDVNISCAGFARLLGYTTASQGHYIQRALMREGLIRVRRRKALYKPIGGVSENLPGSFFVRGGFWYKQLVNDITIL